MLRRVTEINWGIARRKPASVPASIGGGRRFLWDLEERLVWGGADAARSIADGVRWPFERLTWAAEDRVVWPLQDRTATLSGPMRLASVALVAAAAIAAGVFGASLAAEEGGTAPIAQPIAAQPAAAVQPAPRATEPADQVLRGAIPDFTPPGATKVSGADAVAAAKAEPGAASATSTSSPSSSSSSSSAGKAVSPGPGAMQVARQFAAAFVLYETGEMSKEVRTAFHATATPELAKDLLQRPPRQPANAKVPQAKVLNVVPGPVETGTHTVSISLLRVGLTSELRIGIERDPKSGQWLVAEMLG